MFRFSIREILMVMAVAGASTAWWLERCQCDQLKRHLQLVELEAQIDQQLLEAIVRGEPVALPIYSDEPSAVNSQELQ
jgi:hypothetical protein